MSAEAPLIHFETRGQGSDVVLLHGWGLHGGVWDRIADRLAEQHAVHLVDLPGHGLSPAPTHATIDAVTGRIADAFPLPVHVVGWSLGGLVGQHWAATRPDAVRSLTLTATSPRFVRAPDWPHAQEAAQIEAVGASLATAFDATLTRFLALQTLGSDSARETLATLRRDLFAHGRPQGLEAMLEVLVRSDLRADAAAIACPTLLLFGLRDAITPIGAGRWLAGQIADSRLVEFPRASHAPFLSHEADFLAALTAFLTEHD